MHLYKQHEVIILSNIELKIQNKNQPSNQYNVNELINLERAAALKQTTMG
jgi:hypothetical protein